MMVFLSQHSGWNRIFETQTSSDTEVFSNVSPNDGMTEEETGLELEKQNDISSFVPCGKPIDSLSASVGDGDHFQQLNGYVNKDALPSMCGSNGCIAELQNGYILSNHPSLVGLSRRKSCSRRSDFQSSNDRSDCQLNQLCTECRTERFRRQLSSCSSDGSSSRKCSIGSEKRRKSSLGSVLGRTLSFRFLRNLSYTNGDLTDQVGIWKRKVFSGKATSKQPTVSYSDFI